MEEQKSILNNSIFNMLKTGSSILFPIITFLYSARILGVDGVGKVNFARSFISYFTMIASLGMTYYGTREGAKLRRNRDGFSQFCQEMLIINTVTTIIAYVLFGIVLAMVTKLHAYRLLLLVNSIDLILKGMGMEWLYQAQEEYRYIAVRTMCFQIIALIAMFFLVKKADDVVLYAIVTLTASSGSYVLNFINARKYICIKRYDHYEIKKHLGPLIWLFAMSVSIELYTVLDTTMLGFLQGDIAVGKYTAAVKVNKMVNSMIMAIAVVLIPRLSYYIGLQDHKKVETLVEKAYNFTFMLSVPCAVGLFMLSDDIIQLLSGRDFATAAYTMRVMTPIVILIPFSYATNTQTFIPMKKEKLILISTTMGAVTNFACNSFLIPRFAENGAAVGTLVAETSVAIICLIHANLFFDMKKVFRGFWQYWVAAVPIPVLAIVLRILPLSYIITMFLTIFLSIPCYFGILLALKNCYLSDLVTRLLGK